MSDSTVNEKSRKNLSFLCVFFYENARLFYRDFCTPLESLSFFFCLDVIIALFPIMYPWKIVFSKGVQSRGKKKKSFVLWDGLVNRGC